MKTDNMKRRLIIFAMLCLSTAQAVLAQTADYYNVVPLPASITMPPKGGEFVLTELNTVNYPAGNADMQRNALFLTKYIKEMTGMQLSTSVSSKKADKGNIVLRTDKKIAHAEGYTISVDKKGVTISGIDEAAVFRAIQTLRKSLPIVGKTQAVSLPFVTIADHPRFSYRGMHLDCSRHFYSVEFVKQYIDMIALHGMNKFHWHITDDQGWRIEIKKYPRLTEIGGWRTGTIVGHNSVIDDSIRYGGFYTQEQCRDIVRYAADRFITIIPEIDMPGHMVAALAAYPELGCTGGPYEVEHHWGVFPDVLCPGKEKTFEFVQDVLNEVIQIFPSEYIHIGGDESPRDRWKVCPRCQQRIADLGLKTEGGQSKEDKLQGYFTKRVEKFLASKGKRIIGWDELLGCDVDTTATIMSWTGAEPGAKGARLGHDIIMSPNTPMYFDHYQTKQTWSEPLAIGGFSPVEKVYAFEPVAEGLTPQQASHIWGVQANVWCEYISYPHWVEYMVLPRMGALAEVQWLQPEAKNFEQFKKRITKMRDIYELHRWTVAPHLWQESK